VYGQICNFKPWYELENGKSMDDKNLYFDGKYRIPSARLKGWDYRTSADYFITICTKEMVPWFGFVKDGEMHLNDLGKYAFNYMLGINEHKENAKVVNHIVMPNHVHAIISLRNMKSDRKINEFGPLLSDSLAVLINNYKGRITKFARTNQLPWGGWHGRYHDHIIRNSKSFDNINQYISNNPTNWNSDRYFTPDPE
jgi:putative transposase